MTDNTFFISFMFINSILLATFLTMLIKAFSDHAVQVDGIGGSVKYLVSL